MVAGVELLLVGGQEANAAGYTLLGSSALLVLSIVIFRAGLASTADRDREEPQGSSGPHASIFGKSGRVLSHTGAAPDSIATYRPIARGAAISATRLPTKMRGTDQTDSRHP